LQLLAAVADLKWRTIQEYVAAPSSQFMLAVGLPKQDLGVPVAALGECLLLLVQQLQGVSPQLRTAFLHSPAGGVVLRLMGEMSRVQPDLHDPVGNDMLRQLRGRSGQSAQGLSWLPGWASNGPEERPTDTWLAACLSSRVLVQQLLLPGLLLQPAVAGGGGQEAGYSSSSSSTAGCQANSSTPKRKYLLKPVHGEAH
jgi:hypothetical protein